MFVRISSTALILQFIIMGIISYSVGTVFFVVASILCFPYLLIGTHILTNKGLRTKLVDLSNYKFGTLSIPHDYNITNEQAEKLDRLLEAKLNKTSVISPSVCAREVAKENTVTDNEYMYLLIRAAIILGFHKDSLGSKTKYNESLIKKLEDLKKEFGSKPPKDDEPRSKYGFL